MRRLVVKRTVRGSLVCEEEERLVTAGRGSRKFKSKSRGECREDRLRLFLGFFVVSFFESLTSHIVSLNSFLKSLFCLACVVCCDIYL